MKHIRHRLSVRLSLLLSVVLVPSLAMVAVMVILHEGRVVEDLVLKEAKTAALQGASSYGLILDVAVDTKALTLSDILEPAKEKLSFTDPLVPGKLIHVEETRYLTKMSVYLKEHGVQQWEDSIWQAGNFIFASGMDRRGLVPVTNAYQDAPPRGDATPEDAAWDRAHSRGGRQYTGDEQIAAAGFEGNPNALTLVQPYPRDTGEMAWDVAAPIYVKGKHFGGFRVGVSRDRVVQQYHDLTVGLVLLFSLIAAVLVGTTMWLTRRSIHPLTMLSDTALILSMSDDADTLDVRILSTDPTEIGDMARSLDRLRVSLSLAMKRLGVHRVSSVVRREDDRLIVGKTNGALQEGLHISSVKTTEI